ncbi:MAG: hypothetical protein JRG69_13425 [Deltaproteobacteria bacterium]|nr:hypothetical protein [Deltaproteobacteria bacterium]
MIKQIIQIAPVFHGIDDSPLAMHLFQVLGHACIKLNMLEKPVKKPCQKKSRLLIKLERVK